MSNWQRIFTSQPFDTLVFCTGAGTIYSGIRPVDFPTPGAFSPKKGVVALIPRVPRDDDYVLLFEGGEFDWAALYFVPLVDRYVLGGTVESASTSYEPSDWLPNDLEKQGILGRARCFLPKAMQQIIDASEKDLEWRAGIRPMLANHGPVVEESSDLAVWFADRFQLKRRIRIILHYGHGGSGFTFFHDTAERVAEMI